MSIPSRARRYFPILTWGAEYSRPTVAIDQRAMVMVVLGLPTMVAFAFLAGRPFGPRSATVAAAPSR